MQNNNVQSKNKKTKYIFIIIGMVVIIAIIVSAIIIFINKSKKDESSMQSSNGDVTIEDKDEQGKENEQTASNKQEESKKIKQVIEAYAKITTAHDGYKLRYISYSLYARSKNGEDVYKITYSTGYTGLDYVRLVSLDSTNSRIEKKTDLCKEASLSGGRQLIVEQAYRQIWGELNSSSNSNDDFSYGNTSVLPTDGNDNSNDNTSGASTPSSNDDTYNESHNVNDSEQKEEQYATMPDLVGLDTETASKKMEESMPGSYMIKSEHVYTSNKSKHNIVAEQSIKAGTQIKQGEEIYLKIYKYSDVSYIRATLQINCKNVDIQQMAGQEIVVKCNEEQQVVRYLNYDDFSGNDLCVDSQININTKNVSDSIKVDVYINGVLKTSQTVNIENLEGKKIENHSSYISIDINTITINF